MENSEIQAKESALCDVFSKDYIFHIPPYQRPYIWKKIHAEQLLTDLLDALGEDNESIDQLSPYFLGSVVLIKEPKKPKAEIIDGQQRLTTLTILFAVLRDLSSDDTKEELNQFIYESGSQLTDIQSGYRLNVRKQDRDFFWENVQEEKATENVKKLNDTKIYQNDSQANIGSNTLFFQTRLKGMEQEQRDRLGKFLAQRCYLVLISVSNGDAAFRIFSTLNARGINLSITDILKADTIGVLPDEEQQQYTDLWEELEERLGREKFTALFHSIRMALLMGKSHPNPLTEYKKKIAPHATAEKARKFINETLEPMADIYEWIDKEEFNGENKEKINQYLKYLNRLDDKDWIPPALLFFSKPQADSELMLKFVKELEKLAYSLLISGANYTGRVNRYSEVLKNIKNGKILQNKLPIQLKSDEKEQLFSKLKEPIPQKKKQTIILCRLNDILSEEKVDYGENMPIEHILPKQPARDSEWIRWFPDQQQREDYIHNLGNLTLLRSKIDKSEFQKKKKKYESEQNPFKLTTDTNILNKLEWTPDEIDTRQKQLIDLLKKEWEFWAA